MKKFVSTVFSTVVALGVGVSLVGCGASTTPSGTTTTTTTTKTDKVVSTEKTTTGKPPESDTKTHEGKFVAYDKDKDSLKIHVKDKDEDFNVKGITPTSEGKDIKWDDFKKDDATKVTTEKDKVTKVEKLK